MAVTTAAGCSKACWKRWPDARCGLSLRSGSLHHRCRTDGGAHLLARLCQYLGGGTATANICFPSDKVSRSGDIRYHESIADSGNVLRRGFCPTCGTPLTSEAVSRPHLIFLRIGTLDDPNLMGPQQTIWTSQAPDWACISTEIPSVETQPPPVA